MGARAYRKSWPLAGRLLLGCLALGLANFAAAQTVDGPPMAPPAEEPAPLSGPASLPASTTASSPSPGTLPPMHDYAAVLQATESTRVAAVMPSETRSETSSPANTEMPTVAPTALASLAAAVLQLPPAVEPPPALPESERDSEPEPTLTVDANGLPRISGFQHNAPKTIVDLVEAMAPTYQLAPELVLAFMQAESSYNPNALSPKNARGLMQLIPGTAERFNVRKPFDPKQNIRGGMAYLRWLLAYFEGDLRLVAAGYNAGERRVDRYLGVPPFGETRAYVKRVVDALGIEAHPFDPNITEPSARLEQIRASRARP